MKPMAQKLEDNAPYSIFFSAIPDLPETLNQKNSISFPELLCPSLGDLKCSLQLNFLVRLDWLMEQYSTAGQGEKPLTILYGFESDPEDLQSVKLKYPNLVEQFIKCDDARGIHHPKIGIYVYNDNYLRIIVSTANLFFGDWNCHCQSLWISPLCPPLAADREDTAGGSPTYFKSTLLAYLKQYKTDLIEPWINYVRRADFSSVKVCLVTSAPGVHNSIDWPAQCHLHRVGELLSLHCTFPAETKYENGQPVSWDIIAQASSLGFMGNNWLRGTLLRSLASHKRCRLPKNSHAEVKIVYPSKDDVESCCFGYIGAAPLFYTEEFYEKQKWLNNHLCRWKADHTYRSTAMPHCKSYCRVSPCFSKLAWFLLTSANISRSAWGTHIKNGSSYARSYEAGVLFLPKYFGMPYFQIRQTDSGDDHENLFPFIFDFPLTPYDGNDEPWCIKMEDDDHEEDNE